MIIQDVPFNTIDWSTIEKKPFPGQTGMSFWQTVEQGNIRVRIVEYLPGYLADHWCDRGHVVFVLEGSFVSELRDGSKHTLNAGCSYQVGDGQESHRSSSESGAKLLIVD